MANDLVWTNVLSKESTDGILNGVANVTENNRMGNLPK